MVARAPSLIDLRSARRAASWPGTAGRVEWTGQEVRGPVRSVNTRGGSYATSDPRDPVQSALSTDVVFATWLELAAGLLVLTVIVNRPAPSGRSAPPPPAPRHPATSPV